MNKNIFTFLLLGFICHISVAQNTITGNVFRYNNAPIEGVLLDVNGQSTTTTNDGSYELEWADATVAQLTGHKVADYSEGINVADVIAVRRYILAIDTLQNVQVIAADVNGSGAVTALDIVFILRQIQGITDGFDDFPNWIFVPEECNAIPNISSCSTFADLNANNDNVQNFIGIKKGDVISDTDFPINTTIQPAFALEQTNACGNEIYVHCIAQDYASDLAAFQFSVRWNPANLNYLDILPNSDSGFTSSSFSDENANQGILNVVHIDWNGFSQASIETGDIFFTLVFSANGDINNETVIFDNAPTPALVTTWDMNLVETNFIDASIAENSEGISAVDINVIDASNSNSMDGSIMVEAITGGLPPYDITINGSPNSTNLSAGEYTLEITDATGCTWTETIFINATVGLMDVTKHDWLHINKNPIAIGTSPEITLSNNTFKASNYLIINNLGQITQEAKIEYNTDFSFNLPPIEIAGIYWIIIKNDHQIVRLPFVVQ